VVVTATSDLPSDAQEWIKNHRALLDAVAENLCRDGEWPRRTALQRESLARDEPVALAPIFAAMPRLVGHVHSPDERVVLTLFGLAETAAGRRLLDAFVRCLRMAATRYRDEADPRMRGADLDELPLTAAERSALAEILLREAPFLGSGHGAHDEDWEREITEDVVRYWGDVTADDYLRRRARELRSNPYFGWRPATADRGDDARGRTGVTDGGLLGEGDPRTGGLPAAVTLFVLIVTGLAGVSSLIAGFPLPLAFGALCAAAAAAYVWRGGYASSRAPVALLLVVGAGMIGAAGTLLAERQLGADEAQRPERAEAVVGGYVSFTRQSMDWLRDPTVHQPSVAYFRTNFAALDPQRPHKFNISDAQLVVDVPTLVQRAPELSGLLLRVRGELAQSSAVAAYRRATSWALILHDPQVPRMIAVCRVPLARGEEDAYEPGDTIHATGVLLADGGVPRADGEGSERVAYLACASVAKTVARFDLVPRRREK
jgi:hypothetical protein